ncbi:unnamed protein product, partial [Leptidea sinapis]
ECQEKQNIEKEEEEKTIASQIAARQAERKRHRAELMVPHLRHLNFVLFWPHCIHAHHELYERWDLNNIIMVGREEIQLTEELALDILYDGDAPINEASIHMLLSAPALAICFRLLDVDKHFIPPIDPAKKPDEQPPQKTAFDMYKMYSPTREAIFQRRREQLQKMKEESLYKRARRLSEVQRLARQAIEEAKAERQMRKEQRKLEILKIGDLSDEEEDFTFVENETEYFPPPGLLIPGFYTPPNDIAKTNGLAILFPKLVAEHVTPEPEYLPQHVLVLLDISKRYKALNAMAKYKPLILHRK